MKLSVWGRKPKDYVLNNQRRIEAWPVWAVKWQKAGIVLYTGLLTPESIERKMVIRGVQASQELDKTMKQRMSIANVKVTEKDWSKASWRIRVVTPNLVNINWTVGGNARRSAFRNMLSLQFEKNFLGLNITEAKKHGREGLCRLSAPVAVGFSFAGYFSKSLEILDYLVNVIFKII